MRDSGNLWVRHSDTPEHMQSTTSSPELLSAVCLWQRWPAFLNNKKIETEDFVHFLCIDLALYSFLA